MSSVGTNESKKRDSKTVILYNVMYNTYLYRTHAHNIYILGIAIICTCT